MSLDSVRPSWVDNRPSAGWRVPDWAELWRYRELVGFLAWRDVKVRYKQAAFGVAWAVLQPLAGMAVFTVVFHRLAHVPSDGVPYLLFAFVGMLFWSLFSGGLDAATTSLVSNSSLVTKVYFPRAAVPLASVLPRLVDFGISLVLLAGLMAVEGTVPGPRVLLLPVVVLWTVLLAFGLGLAFATMQARYRDAHHALSLAIQLWLYASPVAYASSLVPAGWRWAYALNPLVGVLDAARWAVLGTPLPGRYLLVSAAAGGLAGLAGIALFARHERRLADVI